MRRDARAVTVVALAAAIAACGGPKQDEPTVTESAAPPAAETVAANTPPASFATCVSCHTVEAGKNAIGPSLHDIVGRPAASVAGFAYSPALKASGLTWDEATLDKWLANPMQLVPGTKMVFPGQPDAAKRKQMIDWLAKQK